METNLTAEEIKAFAKIDIARLAIKKATEAYKSVFSKRSDIDKMLDKETGFQQKKAIQLARIMQFYLPTIIENQKIVGADWGGDQKILDHVNKMLQNIN